MNVTQYSTIVVRIQRWLEQNQFAFLSLVVIAFVMLLSAALPFFAPSRYLPLLIGLAPGAGLLLALLRQPVLGLFLIVLGGAFVPFAGPGGINVAVVVVAFLFGLWILRMLIIDRQIRFISSRVIPPLLVFIVISLISFLAGQIYWYIYAKQAPLDVQLGGLFIFILSVGATLVVAHQVNDQRWLEWFTWMFIVLGGFFVIGWLVPIVGNITRRLYVFRFITNSMFWTWLMVLTFSQAVFNRRLRLFWRGMLFGVFLATLYVAFVINYGWKSGWLPSLVAIAAIIVLRYPKLGLFLLPFGLLGFWYLSSQAIATDEYSYSTRIEAWLIVLEIVKVNPVFGLGFANYYWYTPLFPIRGWSVQFNSHSQYVDILAQTGIVGLVGFLWIFVELGLIGWRLRKIVPEGFAQAYVYGALGGLVGTLAAAVLVDWVLPFAYNIGMRGFRASILAWLFLGGLVSLEQIYRNKQQTG